MLNVMPHVFPRSVDPETWDKRIKQELEDIATWSETERRYVKKPFELFLKKTTLTETYRLHG